MSAILSRTAHDHKPMTVIPVIASFDTDGHIAPLYVRIYGDSYKVDSYWIRSKFSNQIVYHCNILDGNLKKPLQLIYYKVEDIWAMPSQELFN